MPMTFRKLPLAFVSAIALFTAMPAAGLVPIPMALAASQKVTADALVANTIKGLAVIIAVEKRNAASRKLTKAEVRLLKAVAQSAGAIADLEKARKARKPKAMSKATNTATVAISRLQSLYAAGHFKEKQLGLAVKGVSANWSAYIARFATVKPDKRQVKASDQDVTALKQKVAKLEKQMKALESRMAGNPSLSRDYARLMAQLQRLQRRGLTIDTYDLALLDLAVIYGWYDGYGWIIQDYYPNYYADYALYGDDFIDAESYWAGYYDAYYASWPADYYEMEFTVTTDVTLSIEESYSSEVTDISEADYESFASSAETEASSVETAEASTEDIAGDGAGEDITDIAAQSEDESADVTPSPEELTAIESGDAPIDSGDVESGDAASTDEGAAPADENPDDSTDSNNDQATDDGAAPTDDNSDGSADSDNNQSTDDGAAPTDDNSDGSADSNNDQSTDDGATPDENSDGSATDSGSEQPADDGASTEEPAPEEPAAEEPPPEEPAAEEPPPEDNSSGDDTGGGSDCTDENPC